MLDFLSKLFGRPSSGATAKERLRLVLLSDHLSLSPDVVESLKHDLIEVISRYVEVDVPNCDVTFEQRDHEVAMLANIPILAMHKRPTPPPAPPSGPRPERTPEPAPPPPAFEPVGIAAAPFAPAPQPSGLAPASSHNAVADVAPRSEPGAADAGPRAPDAVSDAAPENGAGVEPNAQPKRASPQQQRAGANGKAGRRRRRKTAASGSLNGQAAKAG